MSEDSKHNDLQKIITQSLEEMKREQGEKFSPSFSNSYMAYSLYWRTLVLWLMSLIAITVKRNSIR